MRIYDPIVPIYRVVRDANPIARPTGTRGVTLTTGGGRMRPPRNAPERDARLKATVALDMRQGFRGTTPNRPSNNQRTRAWR